MNSASRLLFSLTLISALLLVACTEESRPAGTGGSDVVESDDLAGDTSPPEDAAEDVADAHDDDTGAGDAEQPPVERPQCDDLQPKHCLLPYPSSLYLEPDDSRVTGVTLAFGEESLPANHHGKHVDPSAWRRLDGYGTGTSIITFFPEVDRSGFAREDDIGRSMADESQTLLLEVAPDGTTTRVPHWLEVDGRAFGVDDQALLMRPARILSPATRYVVAFRNLQQEDGSATPRSALFQEYLDGAGDARQARMDEVFAILDEAGVERESLTLAWDFSTASDDALHGTMISLRDQALEAVGPDGPELTVTEVRELSEEENDYIALEITGTFRVPHFMEEVETPLDELVAYRFHRDETGQPVQNGWREEPFWVRVPRSALNGDPHGLFMHGHGQNGSGAQVRADNIGKVAFDHHFITYATDMRGMSGEDVEIILTLILDLSRFHWMADRLHQGIINHVLLNLAMEKRLPELEAITSRGIVVNTGEHYYQGISQGGIYGPTIVAVSPYIQRGHLGVPGTNYSLLLSRSKNFESFYTILDIAYPSRLDQAVGIPLVHALWEQADSVSWYRRLSVDPIPGNEPAQVLLAPAKGDHQVAVVTCEIVARSNAGVALMENYDTEREVGGVEETPYPHQGSAIVLYDYGNPWPPASSNLPPTTVDTLPDPHGQPRKADHHNEQMVHFWRTGEVIDVCGGDGCTPE